MVRCRRFLEIITADRLDANVAARGDGLVSGLRDLARSNGRFDNVRGRGSLCAFTLPDTAARDALLANLRAHKVLALKSGATSIRFRLPLVISADEVAELLRRIAASL